ncbi:MAG: periplasmic heavy metal sensor [Flavobacteriales bacterium]|nr:periplasmic heavy metal sensor [Flavobacteriales bacterium]
MTKVKLLGVAVVVLVLLNVGTLAMLLKGRHGHSGPPNREGPKAIIIERLHFDAEQVKAYDELIAHHQVAIRASDADMETARGALYQELKSPTSSAKDSLLNVLGNGQRTIEATHFAHFEALRSLCRPDQRADFDLLVDDLAGYFSHSTLGERPPPPRD